VQDVAHCWYVNDDWVRVPGAILTFTLHKLAGPGARFGWVHGEDVATLLRPDLRGWSPALTLQRAWGVFVDRGGVAECLRATVEPCVSARNTFAAQLGIADAPGPSLLVRCIDEPSCVDSLRARGVIVSPGSAFGAQAPSLRCSFWGVDQESAVIAARTMKPLLGL
jgi:aspartate/methionine/tyrosine aminotransferase